MIKEDSEYHRKRGAEIVAQIQAARGKEDAVYQAGVRDERKRIVDMLLDMHAKEERHNYYMFIANIIKESA